MEILEQDTDTKIKIEHNYVFIDCKRRNLSDELTDYLGEPTNYLKSVNNKIYGSSWAVAFKDTNELSVILDDVIAIVMNNRSTQYTE